MEVHPRGAYDYDYDFIGLSSDSYNIVSINQHYCIEYNRVVKTIDTVVDGSRLDRLQSTSAFVV